MIVKTRNPIFTRLVLFLSVLLLLFSAVPLETMASDPSKQDNVYEGTFELTGDYDGQFELTGEDLDIFHLENMVPGDRWEGKIHIKNRGKATMEISIISIVNNLTDEDLYDALDLTIKVGDEIIYDGSYGETSKPISQFYKIRSGNTATFDVSVSLPKTVGNEMMNKEMDSTWTFEARYYSSPGKDKEPVKTGFDLTQSNTQSILSVLLFIGCLAFILFTLLRIKKTIQDGPDQQNLSSKKKEDPWDENR